MKCHRGQRSDKKCIIWMVPISKLNYYAFLTDCYEVLYNHKRVFSRRELHKYPDDDELVEIAYWMNQVRNEILVVKS